ncbi:MAG: TonB-dependent receptor [Pseudomonadota bacterium]
MTLNTHPAEPSPFKRHRISTAVLFAIGAANLFIAPTALSQSSSTNDTTDEQEVEQISIIGTRFQNSLVNRLAIDVEDLPYSLQILDEDFIDERGFIRPLETLSVLPNVVSRGDQFSSGGINFLVRGYDADILVNNRPETSSRGFGRRDSSFIERYEVLKGPASISNGPVLPGGIINTVTKLPNHDDDFANLHLRADQHGTIRTEFDGNIGELGGSGIVSGRINLAYENSEFENDIEERDFFAVRPVVSFEFSDSTRAVFSAAFKEFDAVPNLDFAIFQDGSIPESFTPDTFYGPNDGVAAEGDDMLIDGEFRHDFLDNLKLTLRGSVQETNLDYRNAQGLYNYNFDEGRRGIAPSNPVGNFYSSTGSFDEEVTFLDAQLAWTDTAFLDGTFDLVIGINQRETDGLSTFGFDGVNTVISIVDFDSSLIPTPVNTVTPTPFFDFTLTLDSIYAEAILRPSDFVTIIGGIRYDDLVNEIRDPTAGGDDNAEDDFVQITREEDDNTSFRLGATFHVSEQTNVYVSFAESFIPQSGVTRAGDPVGPETAVSYEVGTKISLNNGFRINAAIYHTTREDVANSDPNNGPQESFSVQVGEQTHQGFEITATGDILPGWNVFAGYGYLDAEFTRNLDGLEGLRPTEAPENTFSLSTSYTLQSGDLAGLKFGGGLRWLDDRPGAVQGEFDFDGYTLVDVFASYAVTDNIDLQLNIHNLTDEDYLESIGNNGNASGGSSFGQGRTFFATLDIELL